MSPQGLLGTQEPDYQRTELQSLKAEKILRHVYTLAESDVQNIDF